jgi:hypothetical protein
MSWCVIVGCVCYTEQCAQPIDCESWSCGYLQGRVSEPGKCTGCAPLASALQVVGQPRVFYEEACRKFITTVAGGVSTPSAGSPGP